jgi:hypothetical protein
LFRLQVEEFTSTIFALQWQAIQVRATEYFATEEECKLPTPFAELHEGGLSELVGIAREAGLQALVLGALKIG